jgi:transcription initiation factor IIF auxiliary subunit
MALRIEQGFEYQGEDWWKWWIWIDGPQAELDQVDRVVYVLHPTFPNPVRTVTDRSTKFRLQTAGWGVFLIRAKVIHKGGTETSLTHYLQLEYPDGSAAAT